MKSTHRYCDTCLVKFARNPADPFCKNCPACLRRREAVRPRPAAERRASRDSAARTVDAPPRKAGLIDSLHGTGPSSSEEHWITQALPVEVAASEPTPKEGDILSRVATRLAAYDCGACDNYRHIRTPYGEVECSCYDDHYPPTNPQQEA